MQTTDRGLRPYLYLKLSINDPLEYTARDSTVYTPKEIKCIDWQYQNQTKLAYFILGKNDTHHHHEWRNPGGSPNVIFFSHRIWRRGEEWKREKSLAATRERIMSAGPGVKNI